MFLNIELIFIFYDGLPLYLNYILITLTSKQCNLLLIIIMNVDKPLSKNIHDKHSNNVYCITHFIFISREMLLADAGNPSSIFRYGLYGVYQ